MLRFHPLARLSGSRAWIALATWCFCTLAWAHTPLQTAAPAAPKLEQPAQTSAALEIVRVVDGDTIHVKRGDKTEKLRLLCVDTEETFKSGAASPSKPGTVFGEECALWAQKYFADLAQDGQPARIRLSFPGGAEKRDPFGRLLCHVLLPDGSDYNVMLVRMGKSPYFTKYGYSESAHEAFVAAQAEARKEQRGIWNPATNQAKTEGAPSAKRPYERLLPWWEARAQAVQSFRAARAKPDARVCAADEPLELARAAVSDAEYELFGEVDKLFDEENGELTVLLRTSEPKQALRLRISKEMRAAAAVQGLPKLTEEFQQNYLWFRGRVHARDQGFEVRLGDPAHLRAAGPAPADVGVSAR
jgi:endonuclease YncB( thermonuclease family)